MVQLTDEQRTALINAIENNLRTRTLVKELCASFNVVHDFSGEEWMNNLIVSVVPGINTEDLFYILEDAEVEEGKYRTAAKDCVKRIEEL